MSTRHIAQPALNRRSPCSSACDAEGSGAGASSGAFEAPSYAALLPTASAHTALYRQFFTRAELAALDASASFSAASEINLLRILIVRLLHAAEQTKLTLKHQLQMFAAFCQSALTMASLARFEYSQQRPPPSLRDLVYAMDEVDAALAPRGLSRRGTPQPPGCVPPL